MSMYRGHEAEERKKPVEQAGRREQRQAEDEQIDTLEESPTVRGLNRPQVSPAAAARGAVPGRPGSGMTKDTKDYPLSPADPDPEAVMTERGGTPNPGAPTGVPRAVPVGRTGQRARGATGDQMVRERPTIPPEGIPGHDLPEGADESRGAPESSSRSARPGG
ncbi:MAG TPA: hypothetical protein VFL91_09210 [Thermomicrobiales bacterium]|nr:hypothetical protein [Thermomicrobiales bacterium]